MVSKGTKAVFLSVCPVSFVDPHSLLIFTRTGVLSNTVLQIAVEEPLIDPAIGPLKHSTPTHFVVFPGSIIDFTARPSELSLPMEKAVFDVSCIRRVVFEQILTKAGLGAVLKLSFVNSSILPLFSAMTVLFVVLPVAAVSCSHPIVERPMAIS